jgi:UPF0716 protein FxsA
MALVLLVLLALPVVELIVLVQVASSIGVLNAVGLVIAFSLVGVWLAKRVGLGVVARIRRTQAEGRLPSRELADGALVLLAGGLLVFPGFVSDAIGLALLLPPVRALVRVLAFRRLARKGGIVLVGARQSPSARDGIWDVESWEDPPSPSQGEIEGGPP